MICIDYKDQRSIYEQIELKLKELILNNILKENDKLPSVRELSISLTVNPNTVQRAYKTLESNGFIYSIKGKGNFVAPVSMLKKDADINKLYNDLSVIIKELKYLKESKEKIDDIIADVFKEDK